MGMISRGVWRICLLHDCSNGQPSRTAMSDGKSNQAPSAAENSKCGRSIFPVQMDLIAAHRSARNLRQHVLHRGISWPQFRKTERRTARLKARCAASRSPASSARYAAHLRSIIFSGRSAMTFGKPPKAKLKKLTANRTNQPGRAPVRGSSLRTRGCPACIRQSSTPLSVHRRLRDLPVSIVL